ncbi:hypothetical protein GGF50DRAFT_95731 [Schizophyllum commune]
MDQQATSPTTAPPFDFDFALDPNLLQPGAFQLPPSADLFSTQDNLLSTDEANDFFGFLDDLQQVDFENLELPTSPGLQWPDQHRASPPYSNPHLHTAPDPSTSQRPRAAKTRSATARNNLRSPTHDQHPFSGRPQLADIIDPPPDADGDDAEGRGNGSKTVLTQPQKRLNHIMSEQRRRNTIRDGYAQLITLLAPAGSEPLDMPTRGRPKGSGSKDKGKSKGKSGVLFRAVEYCKWLEEGRDALQAEVLRLEAAAGIQPRYS